MESDFLYHLGLSRENDAAHFGDVRFVCIGGSDERMTSFAYLVGKKLGYPKDRVESIGTHRRYVLYKAGPVLIASHGIGGPSVSILLNELAKLLRYAGVERDAAVWIRLGTCGGVGLEPGALAISQSSLNGALEPYHGTYVLGRPVRRPATFDRELCHDLKAKADELGHRAVVVKTLSCDDFYEGQGRLDGAICEFDLEDKMRFLREAHDGAGVRNIEMESLQFGAFCAKLGLRATTICAVLLDRLRGDQIASTPTQLREFEERAVETVVAYVADLAGVSN